MQLTLATWNLLNFIAPPNAAYEMDNILLAEQWQKKQQWVRSHVAALEADIIGFQEIFSDNALDELLQPYGYKLHIVDKPRVRDGYIYESPVVGIASRLPLKRCYPIRVDTETLVSLGLPPPFQFSRTPVVAVVTHPILGDIRCVSIHLKSQRASVDIEGQDPRNIALKLCDSWASTRQRGTEAALLNLQLSQGPDAHLPTVVMGDFNRDLQSSELKALANNGWLHDSWALYQSQQNREILRPATHYHGAVGSVLDYILLTDHFDHNSVECRGRICAYHCIDRHLINPRYEIDSESSDHAIVQVTATLTI
ncbi:endonuclease/exonuclease/phosphatase family protein [Thaumasiovibrio subtropicus]|uniref:endonuclease/exonuclease/phosphatase family protein n=1 Tax=Thaumasiovibrio subtropicus TaxID=1891207 RepID=UPI000B35F481|nr:endonuclease/exonuclease/phosphatase family protein [Thaumasiovibrio subtropicus]